MDISAIAKAIETVNEQSWLHGVKVGLALLACVFIFFETQAHSVTESARARILRRLPSVVAGGAALIILLHLFADRWKPLRVFGSGAIVIFAVFAAVVGMFAIGVHGIRFGILHTRAKQIIGAILAATAVLFFFLFFHLSYKDYYHRWEFFHYYMGSKYTTELSYKRLYICAAVADAETGNESVVKRRKLRDLSATNLLIPAKPFVENPDECKSHFTSERWEAFKSDVEFFRQVSGTTYWRDMQKDHGYNPPPIWTIAGHYLSSLQPASAAYFKLLAGLDVTLVALLFIAVGWAFGWRALVIALIYWGTQEPAPFYWTGGAFLRQDWFFLSVMAVCLARKKWFFVSGFALAYAAGLRIFPAVMFVGPVAIIGWNLFRRRKLDRTNLRFLAGGVAAVLVLVPLSLHVTGGFKSIDSYKDFAHHISVHQGTSLTNHVGLHTIIKASPPGRMKYSRDNALLDPFERWKAMRQDRFDKYRWLWATVFISFGGLLVYALRKFKALWIGMAMSIILVVGVAEATCYYWPIWAIAAVLARVQKKMEWPLMAVLLGTFTYMLCKLMITEKIFRMNELGALLIALVAMCVVYYYAHEALLKFARTNGSMEIAIIALAGTGQVFSNQFFFIDDKYTAISVVYVAWTVAFVLAFVRIPPGLLALVRSKFFTPAALRARPSVTAQP